MSDRGETFVVAGATWMVAAVLIGLGIRVFGADRAVVMASGVGVICIVAGLIDCVRTELCNDPVDRYPERAPVRLRSLPDRTTVADGMALVQPRRADRRGVLRAVPPMVRTLKGGR